MIFLVFFLLLQETTALLVDTCDDLLAETASLSRRLQEARDTQGAMPDEVLQQFASRSREARLCYGTRESEHIGLLYRRELYALRWLQRYEEAIHVATEALSSVQLSDADRTHIFEDRAEAHERLGRLPDALRDYTEALSFTTQDDDQHQIDLYIKLGFACARLSDYDAAASYYSQAEQRLRKGADVDVSRLAYLLRHKADLAWDRYSPTVSEDLPFIRQGREDALEAARLYLDLGKAHTRNNAGVAYLSAAHLSADLDELDTAIIYARRALQLGEQNQSSLLQAGSHLALGYFLMQQDNLAEARSHFLDALAHARQSGYTDYERRAANRLGDLYLAQGNLEMAKDWIQQAIRHTETARAALGTTDWSASAFDRWQEPYRDLVGVLLAEGRIQEAFLMLEQTRARHLRDLNRQAQLMGDLSDAERLRADSLARRLAEVRNRLARTGDASDSTAVLKRQEVRLISDLDAVLDLEPQPTELPLPPLQHALAERGQVLVSYFIDAPSPNVPARSHAFVLTPNALHGVPLSITRDSLQALLQAISPLFQASTSEADANLLPPSMGDTFRSPAVAGLEVRQFDLRPLHRLYQALIAPIRSLLPDEGRIVLVPDGGLFMLPFGMLLEADTPSTNYDEAPFLVKRYAFSTELAAAMLLRPEPEAAANLDVAAFGRTRFGETADMDDAPPMISEAVLPDLPAVADELAHLKDRFRHTHIALDEAATESSFYRVMNQPRVLHLASHALIHTSPLYNAILLAPDSVADGTLFFHELKHRRLTTPLVVLSGCNTAEGTFAAGEGMQSLQYAFHTTGVPSSLATLWLVDDRAMGRLVQAFYKHLADGTPKDVALQQAQLDYLASTSSLARSPFFWAAPVLYGDPQPLILHTRSLWLWWALGLAVLAALGGAVYARARWRT